MKNYSIDSKVFAIVLSSVFSILFLSVSTVVFSYFLSHHNEVINKNEEHVDIFNVKDNTEVYRFVEYDSETKHSIFGTLSTDKLRSDFRYIKKNDGRHLLISKFDTNEYYCSGTCFCEDYDDERRSSFSTSKSLNRGVIVLVAAISTYFAHRRAKDYFDEKCTDALTEYCPLGSIYSEIDSCEEITNLDDVPKTEAQSKSKSKSKTKKKKKKAPKPEDNNELFRKYWCKGACDSDVRLGFYEEAWKLFKYKKPYREICSDMSMKKEISLFRSDILGDFGPDKDTQHPPVYKAKLKFVKQLDKYCILSSKWGKHDFAPSDILEFEREFFEKKTKSMCTANIRNSAVVCTQVHPSRRTFTDSDWERFDEDLTSRKNTMWDEDEDYYYNEETGEKELTDKKLRELFYSSDSKNPPGGPEWLAEQSGEIYEPTDLLMSAEEEEKLMEQEENAFRDTPFDEFIDFVDDENNVVEEGKDYDAYLRGEKGMYDDDENTIGEDDEVFIVRKEADYDPKDYEYLHDPDKEIEIRPHLRQTEEEFEED